MGPNDREKQIEDLKRVLAPGHEPLLRFFAYEHLPSHLQAVSKPLGELAREMVRTLPPSAERTVGLRKLLEAKDCLVRAALPPEGC